MGVVSCVTGDGKNEVVVSHRAVTKLVILEADDDEDELGSPISESPLGGSEGSVHDRVIAAGVEERVRAWERVAHRSSRAERVRRFVSGGKSKKKREPDNPNGDVVVGMLFTGEVSDDGIWETVSDWKDKIGEDVGQRRESYKKDKRKAKKKKSKRYSVKKTTVRENESSKWREYLADLEKPRPKQKNPLEEKRRNVSMELQGQDLPCLTVAPKLTRNDKDVDIDEGHEGASFVKNLCTNESNSPSSAARGRDAVVVCESDDDPVDFTRNSTESILRPSTLNQKEQHTGCQLEFGSPYEAASVHRNSRKPFTPPLIIQSPLPPSTGSVGLSNSSIDVTGPRGGDVATSSDFTSSKKEAAATTIPLGSSSTKSSVMSQAFGDAVIHVPSMVLAPSDDDASLTGLGIEVTTPAVSSEDEIEEEERREDASESMFVKGGNAMRLGRSDTSILIRKESKLDVNQGNEVDEADTIQKVDGNGIATMTAHVPRSDQMIEKENIQENEHTLNLDSKGLEKTFEGMDRGVVPLGEEVFAPTINPPGDIVPRRDATARIPRVYNRGRTRKRVLVASETEMSLSGLMDEEVQVDWSTWEKTGGQKELAERVGEKKAYAKLSKKEKKLVNKMHRRFSFDAEEESRILNTLLTKEKRRNVWSVNSGHTSKPKGSSLRRSARRISCVFRSAFSRSSK